MAPDIAGLGDSLASFCTITKRGESDLRAYAPGCDPTRLLKDGWKTAFGAGTIRRRGHLLVFVVSVARDADADAWIEVTLRQNSTRDGKPYYLSGCAILSKPPREFPSLRDFAFLPNRKLDDLMAMALPEPWSFTEAEGNDLLRRYLEGTFLRVQDEGKLVFTEDGEGRLAAFATGLVDTGYQDIYCVCVPNRKDGAASPWVVDAFCAMGSRHAGMRLRQMLGSDAPRRANYFTDLESTVFDGTLPLSVNYDHIFRRVHRIEPSSLRVLCTDSGPALALIDQMGASCALDLARAGQLDELIAGDPALRSRFQDALVRAVERAQARSRYMYTSVLPAWNPNMDGGTASFLVPLCLVDEGHVDLVLVASRKQGAEGPYYEATTVLDLFMAYQSARLVQRTDGLSGWVNAVLHGLTTADDSGAAEEPLTGDDMAVRPDAVAGPGEVVEPDCAMGILDEQSREAAVATSVPTLWPNMGRRPLARLVTEMAGIPRYVIHDGDTIGLVRRADDTAPTINLPRMSGFASVSQQQGRFDLVEDVLMYTHLGSNWTLVVKADETEVVLDRAGVRVALDEGDAISFSGSPAFVIV